MQTTGVRHMDATYTATADAPSAARHGVEGLSVGLHDDLVYRLRLLVSDAVTTRVLAQASAGEAGGSVRLEVGGSDALLRGRVSDVARDHPELGAGDDDVNALQASVFDLVADRWGMAHEADGGASIWFEISR
jgi:hypothetical protein